MKIIKFTKQGGRGGGGGEEVGSIRGIQLLPLRTLTPGAACAEETPTPVSACTVGTLRNHNGNANEKVARKNKFASPVQLRDYSNSFNLYNVSGRTFH